jgi:hypothetical protein
MFAAMRLASSSVSPLAICGLSQFLNTAVLALFGWRRRKVSYAVSHERFPRALRPEWERGPSQLLVTEILDFSRRGRRQGHSHQW